MKISTLSEINVLEVILLITSKVSLEESTEAIKIQKKSKFGINCSGINSNIDTRKPLMH